MERRLRLSACVGRRALSGSKAAVGKGIVAGVRRWEDNRFENRSGDREGRSGLCKAFEARTAGRILQELSDASVLEKSNWRNHEAASTCTRAPCLDLPPPRLPPRVRDPRARRCARRRLRRGPEAPPEDRRGARKAAPGVGARGRT